MKTKTAKQPKQSKPTVQLKDIKPKKNPKGGVRDLELNQTTNTLLAGTYGRP